MGLSARFHIGGPDPFQRLRKVAVDNYDQRLVQIRIILPLRQHKRVQTPLRHRIPSVLVQNAERKPIKQKQLAAQEGPTGGPTKRERTNPPTSNG